MYYVLTEALKRRFIAELRSFWAQDPKYKDSLVDNIQGKYSFEQRPQQAIIVKGGSATPNRFSADNFQGVIVSYCCLMKAFGKLGTSIEWIEEDKVQIQKNNGVFPSPPGIYYIEVKKEGMVYQGVPGEYLVFYVDSLIAVKDARPIQDPLDKRKFQTFQGSYHPGSLNVYEMPGNIPLYEGVNYTSNPETGEITLSSPLPNKTYLSIDYYYTGPSTGPFPVQENGADNKAIPGVSLAFGRRAYDGDIQAVVIYDKREGNAREYGGKFELSLDFDVIARDVYSQAEISDRTLMFLSTILRDRLSFEGIEIDQVSAGGESEEVYDETGDDYYYNSSLSATVLTDWSIRVPLTATFNRVLPGITVSDSKVASTLSPEQLELAGFPGGFRYADRLGLSSIQDPWFNNRNSNFELLR